MTKEDRNRRQSQISSTLKANQEIRGRQSGSSINLQKAAPEPQVSGLSVDSRKMTIQSHGTMESRPLQPVVQPQKSRSSIDMLKMVGRPHWLGIQHQRSDTLADSFKQSNQPPQWSGFSVETEKQPFQPKLQTYRRENGNSHGVPHNLVDHIGTREVAQHNIEKVGSWFSNFYMNDDHHIFSKQPNKIGINRLSETHHQRQPLTSTHHHRAMYLVNKHGYQQEQLCKFYAQGRCYYGENCKFLHDPR